MVYDLCKAGVTCFEHIDYWLNILTCLDDIY
jgi:hypothetical protein